MAAWFPGVHLVWHSGPFHWWRRLTQMIASTRRAEAPWYVRKYVKLLGNYLWLELAYWQFWPSCQSGYWPSVSEQRLWWRPLTQFGKQTPRFMSLIYRSSCRHAYRALYPNNYEDRISCFSNFRCFSSSGRR
jgi:hypothetical protein